MLLCIKEVGGVTHNLPSQQDKRLTALFPDPLRPGLAWASITASITAAASDSDKAAS